jgi:hypothetical protein
MEEFLSAAICVKLRSKSLDPGLFAECSILVHAQWG